MERIRVDLVDILSYNDLMRTDEFGQIVLNENDICDLYLQDPDRLLTKVLVDAEVKIPAILEIANKTQYITYSQNFTNQSEFDRHNQSLYFMPTEYKEMDIAKFVLEQCKNDEELQRAGMELLLFQERDMFDLLKYIKYLVDTMRQNNIVWGVGRGSSVSSFVLYLIGIHKINSLYYDLPVEEFLK